MASRRAKSRPNSRKYLYVGGREEKVGGHRKASVPAPANKRRQAQGGERIGMWDSVLPLVEDIPDATEQLLHG